ncbi:MAG: NYN domain-containing protein [Panacagrimonas sp.]
MLASEKRCALATRPIFIDALNVSWWCGKPPSLRMPMALMTHLLGCGRQAILYFDASARYQLKDEAGLYERLRQYSQYSVEVPSGIPADRVMLRHATSSGACIVSRDRYRDHRRRYRKLIDDPTRLISGEVGNDRLRVPSLAVDLPVPCSVDAAWTQLEPLFNR